jgi:hypothetical protein
VNTSSELNWGDKEVAVIARQGMYVNVNFESCSQLCILDSSQMVIT